MKTVLTVVVLLGLLGFAIYIGVSVWISLGDVKLSTVGVLAMAGGIVVSLLLGAGLMFLVFWSSRHGHDDIDRWD